jgi:hypothetical protein
MNINIWFMHDVRGIFPDDVSGAAVGPTFTGQSVKNFSSLWPVKMGPTAAPETSSGNLPRTSCKNPKIKPKLKTWLK